MMDEGDVHTYLEKGRERMRKRWIEVKERKVEQGDVLREGGCYYTRGMEQIAQLTKGGNRTRRPPEVPAGTVN